MPSPVSPRSAWAISSCSCSRSGRSRTVLPSIGATRCCSRVATTKPSAGSSSCNRSISVAARTRESLSSSFQPSSRRKTPGRAATEWKSSSEIVRNARRLNMASISDSRFADQFPSGTTIGDPVFASSTASEIWNSVVVFPIPGGATRIKSPSVVRPLASTDVSTDSCRSSTSSVRAMAVELHLSERRNVSRSSAAAARNRRLSSSSDGFSPKFAPASPWRMTRWNEPLCACCFHLRRFSTVNSGSLESRALAWSWQSQIPLPRDRRCSRVISASYRGPPGAAAQMWPATPTLITPSPSEVAPTVDFLHGGYEHSHPACFASWFLVFGVNLPLFVLPISFGCAQVSLWTRRSRGDCIVQFGEDRALVGCGRFSSPSSAWR